MAASLHTSTPKLALAYGYLALSMALVGSYVALSKPLAAVFPVLLLAWLRFGIGALAMPHWLNKPADEPPLSVHTKWLLFLESFLGNFLFTLCMISGVKLTTAVSAGVIMAAIPAAVAVLSWAFLRERVLPRVWAGVACAVLGIGLLSLAKTESTFGDQGAPGSAWPAACRTLSAERENVTPREQFLQDSQAYSEAMDQEDCEKWTAAAYLQPAISKFDKLLGNLLLLAAVFCEASYAVIGKKLTGSLGPRRITAIINLWGFALTLPFGLWLAWGFDFASVSTEIWLLLVFYALAACMWSVWLWMKGLKSVPASQAGVFTVMLPVSAALVGVTVLGEQLGGIQLLAFSVALAGVVLATWPSRRSTTR